MSDQNLSFFAPSAGNVRRDEGAKFLSYFCRRPPIIVSKEIIDEMLDISGTSGGMDIRLCLHDGPEAAQHDMVVAEQRKNYYQPHKHPAKSDVIHVMRGKMLVITFNNDGAVLDAAELGEGEICPVPINTYHTGIPTTDIVVYHENKPGPFVGPAETIFPTWAPEDENPLLEGSYTNQLLKKWSASGLSE